METGAKIYIKRPFEKCERPAMVLEDEDKLDLSSGTLIVLGEPEPENPT